MAILRLALSAAMVFAKTILYRDACGTFVASEIATLKSVLVAYRTIIPGTHLTMMEMVQTHGQILLTVSTCMGTRRPRHR